MKRTHFARFAAGRHRALALLLGMLLAGAGLAGCGGIAGQPDALAVAAVDGHAISLSDYQTILSVYQALNAQQNTAVDWQSPVGRSVLSSVQQESLDFLINLALMREHVKAPVSARAIAAARAQLMQQRALLSQQGAASQPLVRALTPRAVELLAEQSVYQAALMKQITVRSYSARVILVKTRATAQSLEQQAINGADFGQLAHDNSLDSGTAAQNGTLGPVYEGQGQFPAPFDTDAFGNGQSVTHNGTKYVIIPDQGDYILFELTQPKSVQLQSISDAQTQQNIFNWWLTQRARAHASVQQNILIG